MRAKIRSFVNLNKVEDGFMERKRILFVSQEIIPYSDESLAAQISRFLPQEMNESGYEVRIFMPRFGTINERRHQLHEVIRLSGINLNINDMDQPLIIKVASIPQIRIQVYFIDNDEYFKRKAVFSDKDGQFFEDNDERALFFCRGVLETVKKLGWAPHVIHCHGWMTSMLPLYVKNFYNDDPVFAETRVVTSLYDDQFDGKLDEHLVEKIAYDRINGETTKVIKKPLHANLQKLAMQHSDGVVLASDALNAEIVAALKESKTPFMSHPGTEDFADAYRKFYDQMIVHEVTEA